MAIFSNNAHAVRDLRLGLSNSYVGIASYIISGVAIARLVSWWGIAGSTDCIIRVLDCSIRVY